MPLDSQLVFDSKLFKKELIRLFLIPLIIILILLIIALTFSSPSYHYTDYYYSKNIEINKKIRGVIPPLNQTNVDQLIGNWRLSLVQSFTISQRTKFFNYTLQFLNYENIKIYHNKEISCFKEYSLKIYGNSFFIKQKQKQIGIDQIQNQQSCEQNANWQQLNQMMIKTKIWTLSENNLYFISFPEQEKREKNIVLIFSK